MNQGSSYLNKSANCNTRPLDIWLQKGYNIIDDMILVFFISYRTVCMAPVAGMLGM